MSATTAELRPVDRGGGPALGAALVNVVLGPLALLLLLVMICIVLGGRDSAFDFRHAYWVAGQRVLHGESPYVWTPAQFREGLAFVYPALSAVMFAPLSLMSRGFGSVLFTFVSIALIPATLFVLRVRDWRVYGVTVLWLPIFGAWQTANETIFLVFGIACLWRCRNRPFAAGLMTAVLISLKPFVWPLAIWLVATRRSRASLWAILAGIALNAGAWGAIGFGQVGRYLHAAGADSTAAWRTGYGFPALAAHLGLSRSAGTDVMLVTSALVTVAVLYAGLKRRSELQALTLALALTVISSPLVWSHYFSLLLIPLALMRRRLDWLWVLPVAMWVCPPDFLVHLWQAVVVWGCGGWVLTVLSREAGGWQTRPGGGQTPLEARA